MKIAFFVRTFPPQHESFILNQISGLMEQGHEVTVVSQTIGDCKNLITTDFTRRAPPVLYRPTIPSSRSLRLAKAWWLRLRHGSPSLHGVKRQSGTIATHGLKSAYYFESQPFTKLGPIDLLHCQYGTLGALAIELRNRGVLDAPIVTSFRGFDLTRVLRDTPRRYDRLLAQGDLFLPVCEAFRKRLMDLGATPNKIAVLRSAVDVSRFHNQPRTLPTSGPIRLVMVARLAEKKGVEFAIRAIASLIKQPQPLVLTIIGDGPLRAQLAALTELLRLRDRVVFRGWLPPSDVRAELNQAHIFVNASVTARNGDEEGIPNTLKEAMACGLPVIATRHSGIPELVTDGEHGLLAPERDSQALACQIACLIGQADRWPVMGQRGRKRIEDEYDIHSLNDQLVRHYEGLIANARRTNARVPVSKACAIAPCSTKQQL